MKKFYILDGSGYLYRAYYALPPLTDKNGDNVNAVYGFFRMLFRLVNEKPDYFVIAWDSPVKTTRHEQFQDYKANRPALPDNFKWQIGLVKKLVDELGINFLEMPRYEADDIIHSLVKLKDTSMDCQYEIVSADKDLKQVLETQVIFYDPVKNIKITKEDFIKENGFDPINMVDYLALLGDSSDNIPGVKGIGQKTAQNLVSTYGSAENIYANIDNLSQSVSNKLNENKESAFLSKQSASLYLVPDMNLENMKLDRFVINFDFPKMKKILVDDYGFKSMEKIIQELKKAYQSGSQMSLF